MEVTKVIFLILLILKNNMTLHYNFKDPNDDFLS